MGLLSLHSSLVPAGQPIWRGDELGAADAAVISTGHAALDAQLPGGGWPVGALTEVLQSSPQAHAWQLVLPALAQAVRQKSGPVALIGSPYEPFAPALAAGGLPSEALLWIRSEAPAARLWACEQALRCAEVAAVLAWLPRARVGELRRLQLAAAQHEALLFVFRPESVALSASPARLRLQVADAAMAAEAGAAGQQQMDIHILKRRGPPLAAPVVLPARSERMTALLAASQLRRKARRWQEAPVPREESATVVRIEASPLLLLKQERTYAMDRIALAA
ncbi:translesion DNA synthesis-associated protein ImuA [Variovorax sp. J22R133]|uniref:translesion DNA synthesis-associated protein ImuA n=1 Tax=Variovorax brevis TaxID=3053503 RepID=UPI0025758E7D|nr:translesion DNA synthesis-associated protein ImuA [Variovorax sp. J22R133]MDM0112763.1 translesion DNA synthesis-associated protein ImuA [Variovorax sp. J22R133]